MAVTGQTFQRESSYWFIVIAGTIRFSKDTLHTAQSVQNVKKKARHLLTLRKIVTCKACDLWSKSSILDEEGVHF